MVLSSLGLIYWSFGQLGRFFDFWPLLALGVLSKTAYMILFSWFFVDFILSDPFLAQTRKRGKNFGKICTTYSLGPNEILAQFVWHVRGDRKCPGVCLRNILIRPYPTDTSKINTTQGSGVRVFSLGYPYQIPGYYWVFIRYSQYHFLDWFRGLLRQRQSRGLPKIFYNNVFFSIS